MMNDEAYFLKKGKVFLLMLVSFSFVVGCLLILRLDAEFIASHRRFNDPTFMYTVSGIGLALFGTLFLLSSSKFFTFSPAVELQENGLSGNIFGLTKGYIPWQEISHISDFEHYGETYICVFVKTPEKYLNQGNRLRQYIRKRNHKSYGTPILISTGMIKCEHKALFDRINKALS